MAPSSFAGCECNFKSGQRAFFDLLSSFFFDMSFSTQETNLHSIRDVQLEVVSAFDVLQEKVGENLKTKRIPKTKMYYQSDVERKIKMNSCRNSPTIKNDWVDGAGRGKANSLTRVLFAEADTAIGMDSPFMASRCRTDIKKLFSEMKKVNYFYFALALRFVWLLTSR